MSKINVMFSSRPKLLSEVIRNLIDHQPDMRVAGEVVDPIELIFALRKMPVDVVIITPLKPDGNPRICSQLLKEHPELLILTLTDDNQAVYIFQSDARRKRVEQPSEQTLIDIIHECLPLRSDRGPGTVFTGPEPDDRKRD
ncbi:response regulator transcription factor [bacterium]|nr:response regulator transcription factor [bacterium]